MDLIAQAHTAPFLPHVEENAAALLLQQMEAVLQLRATIAAARPEDIAGEALRVQPHQDRLRVVDDAHGEGHVFLPISEP
jgi:hypothetical protein